MEQMTSAKTVEQQNQQQIVNTTGKTRAMRQITGKNVQNVGK